MSDVDFEGSIQEYGLEVLKAVAEIVGRTTGGDINIAFERDGDDDFAFAITVNGVEWCVCHYTSDDGATLKNHEPMRDAMRMLGLIQ